MYFVQIYINRNITPIIAPNIVFASSSYKDGVGGGLCSVGWCWGGWRSGEYWEGCRLGPVYSRTFLRSLEYQLPTDLSKLTSDSESNLLRNRPRGGNCQIKGFSKRCKQPSRSYRSVSLSRPNYNYQCFWALTKFHANNTSDTIVWIPMGIVSAATSVMFTE